MSPLDILMTVAPNVIDRHYVPPRPARFTPIPAPYSKGRTGAWVRAMTGCAQVWRHQGKSLRLTAEGKNVVVATTTASGKTLAMMAPVIHSLCKGSQGTTLVLCPQRGLVNDMGRRWHEAVALAGLHPDTVGVLDSSLSAAEREQLFARAKVIICTEDIVHAWVMRRASLPPVRHFVEELQMIVIDEAHSLEGVLGSNCASLFRRLRATKHRLGGDAVKAGAEFQFIAASATIADPAGHMEALTGCKFEVVSEKDNGAPFHGLHLLHIEGADRGSAGEAVITDYVGKLAPLMGSAAGIAFMDSRPGVERATANVGLEEVEPYRAGLEDADRTAIEHALHQGKLRWVVSTSAFELGVDVPQFTIALNLGVPQSIKSFKQRGGRAGRSCEAVYAIIAPAAAFTKAGMTLRDMYESPAEGSPLYLGNRIIQYQNGCCLFEECGNLPVEMALGSIDWPEGFEQAYRWAQPGSVRPSEVEQGAKLTGSPHICFSLRKIGNEGFELKTPSSDKGIPIDGRHAFREAYPGATLLQRKTPYRVVDWVDNGYERSIYLESAPGAPPTRPILISNISVSHQATELQEGRLLVSDQGSFAEIRLQVNEVVLGYKVGRTQKLYRDLCKKDQRKSKKHRNFSTTGVVLRINAPWFKGVGGAAEEMREQVAKALKIALARECNIAIGDLSTAHSRIAMHSASGPRPIDDAIAVFDDMPGGLRLTEPLFSAFPRVIARLRRGAQLAGDEALLDELSVTRLARWFRTLQPAHAAPDVIPETETGERLIYASGSLVGIRINGQIVERRLLEHRMIALGAHEQLFYLYEGEAGVTQMVPHDQIEPIGHGWRHVVWDPASDTVREIAA